MARIKENPFTPSYGEIPPVLAGRDKLKWELRDRIDATVEKELHPTGIVLIGPRGCGKTALLSWIEGKAEQKKLPVIRLVKEDFASVDKLVKVLAEQVDSNLSSRVFSFRGGLKDPTGQLGSAEVEVTRKSEDIPIENTLFLTNVLKEVSSKKGLVLLVDEAHDMPAEVGRFFYDTAQGSSPEQSHHASDCRNP